jgi:hypothetical protein
MWRQGDVFISTVTAIPAEARKSPLPHGILVHGEVTGHSHRVADMKSASLFAGRVPTEMFLDVRETPAEVVHEEHGTITLQPGLYRIWRQREYSPEAIRIVQD